jgi:hypothetical protein
MAARGTEKGLLDYIEEADTGITRPSFAQAFRAFPPAKALQAQVGREAIDSFYAVANGFLQRRAASKAIDKRRMMADPPQSLKLIQQVDSELVEIEQSVRKVRSKALEGRRRTGLS